MAHRYTFSSSNLKLFPRSLTIANGVEYGLARVNHDRRLVVLASAASPVPGAFEGECSEFAGNTLLVGPLNAHNVVLLRDQLTWLQPRPLGLKTSAGMGDRIGLATPGHSRAMRTAEGKIAPVFAQESIREKHFVRHLHPFLPAE